MKDTMSPLQLEQLVVEKLEFNRTKFELSDSSLELKLEVEIMQEISENQDRNIEIYKTSLIQTGVKSDEFNFTVKLTGIFSLDSSHDLTEEEKEFIISKNTVAILMPYLRSQVTLLTSQPGLQPIMLPIFNVGNFDNQ